MKNSISFKDRFLLRTKVNNKTGCIEWTGGTRAGYGAITICDKYSSYKYNSSQYAHRISYELFKGKIPKGLLVCHSCDNRKCVNPKHLWLGTYKDNAHDCYRKGRQSKNPLGKGENHRNAKLTVRSVISIRKMFKAGFKRKELAYIFDLSRKNICSIINHERWVDVP